MLEELPKAVLGTMAATLSQLLSTHHRALSWFIQGRYDVDLERRVLRQIWFLNLDRQILLISSWHHLASAVLNLCLGRFIGMNPNVGASAVHGFVALNSTAIVAKRRGFQVKCGQMFSGKIGGPWVPYEEEDAEVPAAVVPERVVGCDML